MNRFALQVASRTLILTFALLIASGAVAKIPNQVRAKYGDPTVTQNTWWDNGVEFVPNEVIIKFRVDADRNAFFGSFAQFGLNSETSVFKQSTIQVSKSRQEQQKELLSSRHSERERAEIAAVDLTRIYSFQFAAPMDARELAIELSKHPAVEYAEPRFIRHLTYTTNDPGNSNGGSYWISKIKANQAWDITKGDTNVVIGIVDSGVQWDHPDIAANIQRNWDEISGNGVDDDGNGFIDDVRGWNFYNNSNDPREATPTHGTHVGGIASAVADNGIGVASIGFNTRLLIANVTSLTNPNGIQFGYEGITYCADNGADIINCSWGGAGLSAIEQEVITYTTLIKNVLVVAAAGNSNIDIDVSLYSPACYRYVMSVINTGSTDVREGTSSYGRQNADVSAPGTNIYSTWQTNTYATLNGTSMASPMTAGLAALVKARFPNLTAEQIGEQVRATADSIDLANSTTFRRKMGKGRINAERALTDTTSPAIRMVAYTLLDPQNDDFPNTNDTITIKLNLKNYLRPASNVTLTLQPVSTTNINVVSSIANISSIGTLQEVENSALKFSVKAAAAQGSTVDFFIKIDADGGYTDYARLIVTLKPTYRTLSLIEHNIQFTINNRGLLGFNNFPTNTQGVGFRYKGTNLLFEGALMFGYSDTKFVNAARNTSGAQDADFISSLPVLIQTPSPNAPAEVTAIFTDGGAPVANRIGLNVRESIFLFNDPLDTNYIIMRLETYNTTATNISNFYAGVYLDWDIDETGYANNFTNYDAARGLGYTYNPTLNLYAGIVGLDTTASFRALTNANPTRAEKWGYLTGGTSQSVLGPGDMAVIIGDGPFNVPAGDSVVTAFALIGGNSLASLQTSTTRALQKWASIKNTLSTPTGSEKRPNQFVLSQNYPNPFNPSTVIGYQLPVSGDVRLEVFDLLGRKVATLVNAKQSAGSYSYSLSTAGYQLSSGVYFYRLQANSAQGNFVQTKKMLLIK